MDFGSIVLLVGTLFGIAGIFAFVGVYLFGSRRRNRVRELVTGVLATGGGAAATTSGKRTAVVDIEEVKRKTKEQQKGGQAGQQRAGDALGTPRTAEDLRFFRAGIFTQEDREAFRKFEIASPIVCTVLALAIMLLLGAKPMLLVAGCVLGIIIGASLPRSWLERQTRFREEETLYYLPLMIEQISIGVSSSLDLWPCVSHILEMARARDSHNVVTELFASVEKLIMSGLNFQAALDEVANACGIQQVKHSFKFLAQCADHGGEVSKHLQELANAVMTERQTKIEAKIASLPVKATGPLFAVFAGFFVMMLAGIFTRFATSLTVN